MRKRIVSMLLMLNLMLCLLPHNVLAAYSTSHPNTHTNTGNQAADIVAIAKTQVGYQETGNNHTKYNFWFDNEVDKGETGWCAMFISWCANQAGIPTSIIAKTSSAGYNSFSTPVYSVDSYTPEPGDIVYVNNSGDGDYNHVGLVVDIDNTYIYTIEGNWGAGSTLVSNVKYYRNTKINVYESSAKIILYGAPNYTNSTLPHTHSYTVFRYYGGYHPHYAYYQCASCEDIKAKQEFGFLISCSECMNNHTHTHDKYLYFGGYHPHYCYYECRCGEIIAKEEFAYSSNCKLCINQPEKPEMEIEDLYTNLDNITFEWNTTLNTTHYNIYIKRLEQDGTFKLVKQIDYAESGVTTKLEPGYYYVILESKNSNYWNAEGTDWLSTYSDYYYFNVIEEIPYTETVVTDYGSYKLCNTEIINLDASCSMIVAAYKGNTLVSCETREMTANSDTFAVIGDIDEIKVMVWDSITTMNPLTITEVIPSSKFTTK